MQNILLNAKGVVKLGEWRDESGKWTSSADSVSEPTLAWLAPTASVL